MGDPLGTLSKENTDFFRIEDNMVVFYKGRELPNRLLLMPTQHIEFSIDQESN